MLELLGGARVELRSSQGDDHHVTDGLTHQFHAAFLLASSLTFFH